MQCALCNGELIPLGQLGNRLHFRCRQCGAEYGMENLDIEPLQCCGDPQLRGGCCINCGQWTDDNESDLPQVDNEW